MSNEEKNTVGENVKEVSKKRRRPRKKKVKGDPNIAELSKEEQEREKLRQKLKETIREKKLTRTSHVIRDNKLEELRDTLKETKNPARRKAIKAEISLLRGIEEKLIEAQNSDYPTYED